MTLNELVGHFREWLHLPDPYPVRVVMAAWAANRLAGRSVWLMVVGPPSSGKSEILDTLRVFDDVTTVSSISGEAALLSAVPKEKRAADATGGLLGESGTRKLLLIKDFTTIISMPDKTRNVLLAAFREIYDGRYERDVGTDGGKKLHWSGKCDILAGVTTKIETMRTDMADLGERWLYCRVPRLDPIELATKALTEKGESKVRRAAMHRYMREWGAGLDFEQPFPELEPDEIKRVAKMATLACTARSHVQRDKWTRDVEYIPEPEAPGRFSKMLHSLYAGLLVVGDANPFEVLGRCCKDAVPRTRLRLLECAARGVEFEKLGMPKTTLKRTHEDLEQLSLLDGENLTPETAGWWESFDAS